MRHDLARAASSADSSAESWRVGRPDFELGVADGEDVEAERRRRARGPRLLRTTPLRLRSSVSASRRNAASIVTDSPQLAAAGRPCPM